MPPQDKTARLRGPDGKLLVVSEFEARKLLRDPGFRRDTGVDVVRESKRAFKKRKFSAPEEKLKGVGEAVGQGLTGGLLGVAQTKLFDVDPEDIQARRESLGRLGDALELGSLAGGSFLGSGLLAGGTRLARGARFTPTRS